MGEKQRYRIINQKSLLTCLEYHTVVEEFRKWYIKTIDNQIATKELQREAFWTEAVAVGTQGWIKKISTILPVRKRDIARVQSVYNQDGFNQHKVSEDNGIYALKGSKRDQSYVTRLKI